MPARICTCSILMLYLTIKGLDTNRINHLGSPKWVKMKVKEDSSAGNEEGEKPGDSEKSLLLHFNGPYSNCRLPTEGPDQTIRRWFAYGRHNSEWHRRRSPGMMD